MDNDKLSKEQRYKKSIENLSNLCRDYTSEEFKRIYEDELRKHNNKSSNQSIFDDEQDIPHYDGDQPYFNENENIMEEPDVEWMENESTDFSSNSDSTTSFYDDDDDDEDDDDDVVEDHDNYSDNVYVSPPPSYDKKSGKGIRTILTILVVVIGGIWLMEYLSTPRDTSPVITDSSRVIPNTNITVYIENEDSITEDKFSELFDHQPQALLENCQEIYVCDGTGDNTCVNEVWDQAGEKFDDYSGWAFSDGQKILINASYFEPHDQSNVDSVTFLLGLQYCYASDIKNNYDWQQLYQHNGHDMDEYDDQGNEDVDNFFALACEMYFNHPDELQEDSPGIYNTMQNTFHHYE